MPWEKRLEGFMSDPELALMFVGSLRTYGSVYGRESLANLLNDVLKDYLELEDHPERSGSLARR